MTRQAAINRKNRAIATISGSPTISFWFSVARMTHPILGGPGILGQPQNYFAHKTLRDNLP
jgi:hypothetical protein